MTTKRWQPIFIGVVILLALILVLGPLSACRPAPPAPAPPAPTPAPTPAPPPMKPITLRYDLAIMPPPSLDAVVAKWVGDEVEKRTNGLIKFEYFYSTALTKPGEELDAVKSGLSDMSLIIHGFYPAKLFLNRYAAAVPFGPNDPRVATKILDTLLQEIPALSQEFEKYDTKYLWGSVLDPEALEALTPIRTVADLDGKKIAMTGNYGPRMLEAVGATPVVMSIPDRVTGLQTGTIDGSILGLTVTFPFKLYEFAKHTTRIELLGAKYGAAHVIRLSLFNELPKDIQQIILDVSKEAQVQYTEGQVTLRAKFEGIMGGAGVTFYDFPESERVKWANMLPDLPAEWIKEGEAMGKPAAGDIMRRFLELSKAEGHQFPREWVTK